MNITGLIAFEIVDSINSVKRGRTSADMLVKRHKIILPFLAHGDASTTVISPVGMRVVGASVFSIRPCDIFGRLPHTVSAVIGTLVSETTTRGGKASSHVSAMKRLFDAAIATAKVYTVALMCDNKQTTETLSRYVDKWRHDNFQLSHGPLIGNLESEK